MSKPDADADADAGAGPRRREEVLEGEEGRKPRADADALLLFSGGQDRAGTARAPYPVLVPPLELIGLSYAYSRPSDFLVRGERGDGGGGGGGGAQGGHGAGGLRGVELRLADGGGDGGRREGAILAGGGDVEGIGRGRRAIILPGGACVEKFGSASLFRSVRACLRITNPMCRWLVTRPRR